MIFAFRAFEKVEAVKYLFSWYIILNIVAQFPKRMFFRNRPWRKRVAIKLSSDQASSFPSRSSMFAVTALFSILIFFEKDTWKIICYCVGAAIPILHSRVYLGAHFFSDCMVAFITVRLSSNQGSTAQHLLLLHLSLKSLYRLLRRNRRLQDVHFEPNRRAYFFAFMFVLNIALSAHPIYFWNKSAPMMGGVAAPYLAYLHEKNRPNKQLTPQRTIWAAVLTVFYLGLIVVAGIIAKKFGKDAKGILITNALVFMAVVLSCFGLIFLLD